MIVDGEAQKNKMDSWMTKLGINGSWLWTMGCGYEGVRRGVNW